MLGDLEHMPSWPSVGFVRLCSLWISPELRFCSSGNKCNEQENRLHASVFSSFWRSRGSWNFVQVLFSKSDFTTCNIKMSPLYLCLSPHIGNYFYSFLSFSSLYKSNKCMYLFCTSKETYCIHSLASCFISLCFLPLNLSQRSFHIKVFLVLFHTYIVWLYDNWFASSPMYVHEVDSQLVQSWDKKSTHLWRSYCVHITVVTDLPVQSPQSHQPISCQTLSSANLT